MDCLMYVAFTFFPAPLLAKDSPTAIDGEYLVVFKEEMGDDEGKASLFPYCVTKCSYFFE